MAMKRLACWVLMTVILLSALPTIADDGRTRFLMMSENVKTSGDFLYTVKGNGTATIVGYTGKHTDIILPNMIDGYVITTIGWRAFSPEVYTSREKGDISITLPDTVTTIEKEAFVHRSIRTINIPENLEYIDGNVFDENFDDDGNILNIQFRISNNHPHFAVIDGSLYYKDNKELIYWAEGSSIPEGITTIAAHACMGEGIITVPASVTTLGEGAFLGMTVKFDKNSKITEIPDNAFSSCKVYNIPTTVTKIGESAFTNVTMKGDTLVTLLQNIEEIGDFAFGAGDQIWGNLHIEANNDIVVVIPASLRTISRWAFSYMQMENHRFEFEIQEGVERIESYAFQGCNIESIYLPKSLKSIEIDAFDKGVQFIVEKGSYAERWANENAFPYTVKGEIQNLDWLNN